MLLAPPSAWRVPLGAFEISLGLPLAGSPRSGLLLTGRPVSGFLPTAAGPPRPGLPLALRRPPRTRSLLAP
ncbi:hypothetical protein ACIGXX_08930 [Streptomyces sp. NPDC055243]|uniref:hypothetical protein n=1 Tax=Streptomyces sp. NPDC055243 TaxID=3365720 RepID=UPI0037D037CC